VEDGQPVILSKKMKRAIKMKDDLESFNKAMIEDLKAAGFKESEIKLMTEQDSADDEENSVERKRRKTLNKLQSGG
jgi:hypothetical protein